MCASRRSRDWFGRCFILLPRFFPSSLSRSSALSFKDSRRYLFDTWYRLATLYQLNNLGKGGRIRCLLRLLRRIRCRWNRLNLLLFRGSSRSRKTTSSVLRGPVHLCQIGFVRIEIGIGIEFPAKGSRISVDAPRDESYVFAAVPGVVEAASPQGQIRDLLRITLSAQDSRQSALELCICVPRVSINLIVERLLVRGRGCCCLRLRLHGES